MERVSRVCVLAKPSQDNPAYHQWQIADIAIFTVARSRDKAIESARLILRSRQWEVLRVTLCDLLVEQCVQKQGGEVWQNYQQALLEGHSIKIFPRHFGAGTDAMPAIRPPRITEAFVDLVVADVGGCRIESDGKTRLVDYRVDEWLFELKDLQREGLLHRDRQKKLAKLFQPYRTSDEPVRIDPQVLDKDDRRRFFDILSSPIQGQVKSASKQIRATKDRLGLKSLRGGIIYLNTGYGSLPDAEFGPMVARYVEKDTTQIEAILAVSTWSVTNGFDSYVFLGTYPPTPEQAVIRRLQEGFNRRFEQAMTKLVLGQLGPSDQLTDPLAPLTFNVDGLDFAWLPPEVPASWQQGE